MPKQKSLRGKKQKTERRVAPLQRELAMPKYGYQSPRSGSFVTRYDEVEERKKKAGDVPVLRNFNFAL